VILRPTPLPGAAVVEPERVADERGFFARTFDAEVFTAHGLDARVVQSNTSFNLRAGTLRGMHFQLPPRAEAKLVRCTRGAIFDVAIDMRPDSEARYRWHAVELTAENGLGFFIPAGFAHGFQTLADATEVLYLMSTAYAPEAAVGVRWDDPTLAIEWPEPPEGPRIISSRDAGYALLPRP
jgi:dTDP-4-dehydrorhamnose 3,5-epimerase